MMKRRHPTPPKRDHIAGLLLHQIWSGHYEIGAKLPTVNDLAAEHHVSTKTAHEALKVLIRTGAAVSRPGSGTYVAPPTASSPTERLHRVNAGGAVDRPGESKMVLRADTVDDPPPDVLDRLELAPGCAAGRREYVISSASGVPVTYGTSWFAPHVWNAVPALQQAAPIRDGNIGAIHRALGRVTVGVVARRMARIGSDREVELLRQPPGSAVLVEVTECLDRDGEVTEYNISVHPSGAWIGD